MSTVQKNLFKLALIIDPFTKDGQRINDSASVLTVTGASNATPIVITTSTNHGLVSGNRVYNIGQATNTNANNTLANPNWVITYVSPTTFSLNGSSGNGATGTGTCYPALIGSVDGANFPKQRLLDMYNQARMVLFNAIYKSVNNDEISKYVYGSFITASLTIPAYSAPYKFITKPSGFIRLVGMVDGAATPVPIIVLPNNLLQETKKATNPYYTVSATNLLAFEVKVSGVDGWGIVGNFGTTPASCDYYGITDWTLSDVLTGTATEVFSSDVEYMIIQIAEAISQEQGEEQINALALKLLGKGN